MSRRYDNQYDDDRQDRDGDDNSRNEVDHHGEGHESFDSPSKYQFSIVNGQVTEVTEFENGRAEIDRMEWDEQWSYQNGQVLKTERDDGYIETTTYADIDNDGYFTKINENHGPITASLNLSSGFIPANGYIGTQFVGQANWLDGYKFDIVNGNVKGITELDEGRQQSKLADWNETWSVQGDSVVKTESYGTLVEATVYSDTNGDGTYIKVLEAYGPSSPTAEFRIPTAAQITAATTASENNLITVYGEEGVADDLYRIYEAAFNRAADASGLGYWINQAQQGETLTKIAEHFVNSQEFSSRYGDFVDDNQFVEALYQNILGRASDDAGQQYWVQSLQSNQSSKAVVLASFGNSNENMANLADDIAAGIQYSAFVV